MPIEARKPEEVFERFQDHIGRLFRQTLPVPAHIRLRWLSKGGVRATLEFVRGDGVARGAAASLRGYTLRSLIPS